VQKRRILVKRISKEEKERKRKSSAGDGITEGVTKEEASILYKEKCTGEQDEVF